jgi:hypothetical protein
MPNERKRAKSASSSCARPKTLIAGELTRLRAGLGLGQRAAESRLQLKYEFPTLQLMHVYAVRPRKDKRGVDLISDALPFGRLWYGEPNAISMGLISTHSQPFVIQYSTGETNASSHLFCRHPLADVCATQWTRSSPICGLCPRAVLHHAQPHRRKATCLADDLHRRVVRPNRKHPVAASEKGRHKLKPKAISNAVGGLGVNDHHRKLRPRVRRVHGPSIARTLRDIWSKFFR